MAATDQSQSTAAGLLAARLTILCCQGDVQCFEHLGMAAGFDFEKTKLRLAHAREDTPAESTMEMNVFKRKKHEGKETKASGIPYGCIDYDVRGGKLVKIDTEGTWRMAGHGKLGFGFELTQDKNDQEGHLLCRQPFETKSNEIIASLEYVMQPKSAAEGGGQGLCIYLVDPTVRGWDRQFDGTDPLGFVGKKGAILGVGIDCTGTFCEGQPASVAIKRARDSKLLCEPVVVEGGVATQTKANFWRKIKIKFDIEANTCDVAIGGVKVLDAVKFEGVKIPHRVCIGVCAGTADGKSNHMCINKLKLKAEDD